MKNRIVPSITKPVEIPSSYEKAQADLLIPDPDDEVGAEIIGILPTDDYPTTS